MNPSSDAVLHAIRHSTQPGYGLFFDNMIDLQRTLTEEVERAEGRSAAHSTRILDDFAEHELQRALGEETDEEEDSLDDEYEGYIGVGDRIIRLRTIPLGDHVGDYPPPFISAPSIWGFIRSNLIEEILLTPGETIQLTLQTEQHYWRFRIPTDEWYHFLDEFAGDATGCGEGRAKMIVNWREEGF